MKNTFRKVYHILKHVPGIGRVFQYAWHRFQKSTLSAFLLRRKDKQRAEEVMHSLFGEQGVSYLREFVRSPFFKRDYSYGHSGDFDVMILYALVRAQRPEIVLETGVASGRSSTAILAALAANNHGTLYSIDLPHFFIDQPTMYRTSEGNNELTGFVPEGNEPGWLVPHELRARWNLILGDAKIELTELLKSVPKVDLFYHDSDHSAEHMKFEFETVYPKLSPHAFMISDDVRWNNAWSDFMKIGSLEEVCIYRNLGISRKT